MISLVFALPVKWVSLRNVQARSRYDVSKLVI